jgi:hypothetical protein
MLRIMPAMAAPITRRQFDSLADNLHQLNILDAGLTEQMQRALGIDLHCWDLWIKSKGKWDFRFNAGHERLKEAAEIFCGVGNPVAERHGDLTAAHLAIDFHDTQTRLAGTGQPLISPDVHHLLNECRDLYELTLTDEKRVGLVLDFLSKRQSPA